MILSESLKVRDLKIGTDNCNRAYIGNDLVFQQGKWVLYKTKTIRRSSVAEYNDRILTVEDESPNGGKFLFMIHEYPGAGAIVRTWRADGPLFMLDKMNRKDNEAYVLDFKLKDKYHFLLTIEMGKFDVDKKRFYDGHIYEKDKDVSSGWIEAYPIDDAFSTNIDIYKWQEV